MRNKSLSLSRNRFSLLWFIAAMVLFSAMVTVNLATFTSAQAGLKSTASLPQKISAKVSRAVAMKSAFSPTVSSEITTVDGKSDIFAAGLTSEPAFDGGGGSLPIEISLSGGVTSVSFSATGQTNCCGSTPNSPPDGGSDLSPTDINNYGGISGIKAPNTMMLVGVFLGSGSPSSTSPSILDFNTIGMDFTTLSPELQQTFFVGDGLTSGGESQAFIVPTGATRLFLGIADAGGFKGDPSWYDDNTGSFEVTVTQQTTSATPAPTSTPPPLPTTAPTLPPIQGETSDVFGYVSDSNGDALQGVTVSIVGNSFSNRTETDADGYYELTNLAAGIYTLTYGKEGYQTETVDITLKENDVRDLGTLTLEEEQAVKTTISGYVVDADENAIQGVTVTAKGSFSSDNAETDADGYYELTNLAAGIYTLTYEKEGYQTETVDITLKENDVRDLGTLILEEITKTKISGFVMDISNNPIESAKLSLKGIKTGYNSTTSSDADGFFEFSNLEADTYVIIAKKKGYKNAKQTLKLGDGEDREIEIEMKKTSKRIIKAFIH